MKEFFIDLIKDLIVAAIIAVVVLQFVKPVVVRESSMEENFYENDYLLISKQAYRTNEVARGDVIVFKSDLVTDDGEQKLLIKRVIGLPGDRVTIENGQVLINDLFLNEEYIKDGETNGDVDVVVPDGEFFCMGDNRLVSIDSRSPEVGCVEKERIVGKVFMRLYPFNKIGAPEEIEYN